VQSSNGNGRHRKVAPLGRRLTDEQKAARVGTKRERDALAAEETQRRRDRSRERVEMLHGRRKLAGVLPTRESAAAGVPCVSCGLPYIRMPGDREPPEGIAGAAERTRIHWERLAAFQVKHSECIDPMPTWQGGHPHCFECCPSIPFPEETYRTIAGLLGFDQSPEEREAARIRNCNLWRLTLRCGHLVDQSVNKDQRSYHTYERALWCKDCNDYRAVTSANLVGALADLNNGQKQKLPATKRAITAQRRTLQELERQVNEARRRLTELTDTQPTTL
jgi:hypothetical protein